MKKYKYIWKSIFAFNFLIVGIALALPSCSSRNSDAIEIASETPVETPIVLSETQFQSSNMKLAKMKMQAFHEVVKANGMFDVPPENKASVSSYFGGTVKSIQLLTGEQVKKGQTLFILENPDFVQMQQDYLEAKSQLTYLKSDYERQKNLAQDNVTSQKNFFKAESDYTVTKVKVESLGKKLALMNINPNTLTLENMRSAINITSPIDGYITKINVTRGSFLNPSQAAIELVNTDHLHIELNIFEKDLPKVRIGQTIHFKIQEDTTQEYDATVHLVNKTIDPENRTIGIHGHLVDENISHRFTPGMYVEATIYTTSESKAALPQDAVVELEGKYYVLVLDSLSNNEYLFLQKEVNTGVTTNGFIEILNAKDFKNNPDFLIKGAFNLIKD